MTDRYAESDNWPNPPTSRVVGEGSDAQQAREARYAEAIGEAQADPKWVTLSFRNPPDADRHTARAVMAVRDDELEQARAEAERMRGEVQQWHDTAYRWAYFNQTRATSAESALTEAREQLSRLREDLRELLDEWENTPGAFVQHGSVLASAWKSAAIALRAVSESEQEAGEAQWWDADHNRPADAYTPPERTYCKRCGGGRLLHGEACVIKPSRGIRTPAPSGSDDTKGGAK